jgi:hypothetical protein
MQDDTTQFIQNLETRFGGPIGFRTYSTWFASDSGIIREYGVFLYQIAGVFHFEDFERQPAIFGIQIKPRKNAAPYEKFERSFSAGEIESISVVAKSKAISCAQGYTAQKNIEPANSLGRLFRAMVTRVVLKDGETYFFELIDHKKFLQALQEV